MIKKLNYNFKKLPKPVVIATAVFLLVLAAAAGVGLSRSSSSTLALLSGDTRTDKPETTAAPAVNLQKSPEPSATPMNTKAAAPQVATFTPKPVRDLDVKSGPCQGINATDEGCIKKDTNTFSIASVILWPSQTSCSGNSVTVNFHPLIATRHYTAGGGGNAVVQVDYSDGTSSPAISLPFTVGGANAQSYSGLTHTFPDKSVSPTYRVRLISPNSLTLGWYSVAVAGQAPCFGPSPTASPMY